MKNPPHPSPVITIIIGGRISKRKVMLKNSPFFSYINVDHNTLKYVEQDGTVFSSLNVNVLRRTLQEMRRGRSFFFRRIGNCVSFIVKEIFHTGEMGSERRRSTLLETRGRVEKYRVPRRSLQIV